MSVTRLRLITFAEKPPLDKGELRFRRPKFLNDVSHSMTVTMLVAEANIANNVSHSRSVTILTNDRTLVNEVSSSKVVSLLSNEAHLTNAVYSIGMSTMISLERTIQNEILNKGISVGLYDQTADAVNEISSGDIEVGMFGDNSALNHVEWSTPIFISCTPKTIASSVEVEV